MKTLPGKSRYRGVRGLDEYALRGYPPVDANIPGERRLTAGRAGRRRRGADLPAHWHRGVTAIARLCVSMARLCASIVLLRVSIARLRRSIAHGFLSIADLDGVLDLFLAPNSRGKAAIAWIATAIARLAMGCSWIATAIP